MSKFMIATSLMLFWGFYEMSGGADFEPPLRETAKQAPVEMPVISATVADVTPPVEIPTPAAVEVIRASYVADLIIEPAIVIEETTLASSEELTASQADLTTPIYFVDGNRVNMRDGPSTDHLVLDTLPRGTQAEILAVNADGWAQVRLLDGGQVGWMAKRLLSDS